MLVSLLITLLILAIVLYAVNLIIVMLNIDPRIKQILWLIIAVIVILYLLNNLGVYHLGGGL